MKSRTLIQSGWFQAQWGSVFRLRDDQNVKVKFENYRSLKVRTRSHRHFRAKFYGCSAYHDKGKAICPNGADVPMAEADGMVLEVMLDDVLTPDVLGAAVEAALQTLVGDQTHAEDHGDALEEQIRRIEQERDRLVQAV